MHNSPETRLNWYPGDMFSEKTCLLKTNNCRLVAVSLPSLQLVPWAWLFIVQLQVWLCYAVPGESGVNAADIKSQRLLTNLAIHCVQAAARPTCRAATLKCNTEWSATIQHSTAPFDGDICAEGRSRHSSGSHRHWSLVKVYFDLLATLSIETHFCSGSSADIWGLLFCAIQIYYSALFHQVIWQQTRKEINTINRKNREQIVFKLPWVTHSQHERTLDILLVHRHNH